jgi:hypothetical protein
MDKVVKAMRDMGQAQAQLRRDKARATAMKRKEEYLGARVPGELRAKVIDRANELGIPVSILIRNILEEAFSTTVMKSVDGQAEARDSRPGDSTNDYPNVIGWEQITLNRSMTCTGCARQIEPRARVTLGLTSPGEDHVILCSNCKASG